jgi:hypothetical protein
MAGQADESDWVMRINISQRVLQPTSGYGRIAAPIQATLNFNKSGNGGMAEWFKAPVLKTGLVKANVGSNPSPSAKP